MVLPTFYKAKTHALLFGACTFMKLSEFDVHMFQRKPDKIAYQGDRKTDA